MKKMFVLSLFVSLALGAIAQNPISWTFTSQKKSDNTYEVHLTATIQPGWHLYSQIQPEDAIAMPTGFSINNNPLITLEGKIKEVGKIEKFHDAKLDLSANQYSRKVDFVQVVKVRGNAKTNFTGSVEFQTCNDERCLPPKTVNFNIALN